MHLCGVGGEPHLLTGGPQIAGRGLADRDLLSGEIAHDVPFVSEPLHGDDGGLDRAVVDPEVFGSYADDHLGAVHDRLATDGSVLDSPWATLRESQSATLALPATGQAVTIDVGDSHDIHPRDKRTVFCIPFGLGRTVVGTTDTFYDGSLDDLRPTRDDVTYLLETANAYFPRAALTDDDVLATWSGLRPLLKPDDENAGASAVSREHEIYEAPGFITIAGGKLTTFRLMAARIHLRCDIDPEGIAAHFHRERAHIVGKLVKGAAGRQVKAGIMPVTGEDAVVDRAFVKRKPHVRAAVVHTVDFAVVLEQRHGVALDLDGQIARFLKIRQLGGLDKMGSRSSVGVHGSLL